MAKITKRKNLEKMLGEATTIEEKLALLSRYWSEDGQFIRPFRAPFKTEYRLTAEVYEQAGMFESAGHFAQLANEDRRAIDLYEKAGRLGIVAHIAQSIALFERNYKMANRAIDNFKKIGDLVDGANLAERMYIYDVAFDLRKQIEDWFSAARDAEELGLKDEAKRLYRLTIEREKLCPQFMAEAAIKGEVSDAKQYVDEAIQKCDYDTAASLAIMAGDIPRAAEIYESKCPPSDYFIRPYHLLMRYGLYEQAMQLCIRHRQRQEPQVIQKVIQNLQDYMKKQSRL